MRIEWMQPPAHVQGLLVHSFKVHIVIVHAMHSDVPLLAESIVCAVPAVFCVHQAFRQSWQSSVLGSIDMSILQRMADPQMVMQAQKDPEFYKVCGDPLDAPGFLDASRVSFLTRDEGGRRRGLSRRGPVWRRELSRHGLIPLPHPGGTSWWCVSHGDAGIGRS